MLEKKRMTAGMAIVECIAREGVSHVFNVPGESYLCALDAFFDYPQIQLITNRQEGGACYMAEAFAKISGQVGVCFVTRGPGATNASIGVHCAHQDSTALVLFVGQVPSMNRGREAFQEVDYGQFFGSMAKWVVELNHPAKAPEVLRRAFHLARSGRPGPVVVSLPEDVLAEEADMYLQSPIPTTPPYPAPQALANLIQCLNQSSRPIMIVGEGAHQKQSRQALIAFAERFQVPVISSWRRNDVFPNQHDLYVGSLGTAKSPAQDLVRKADTIFTIGDRLSEVTTGDYQLPTPQQTLLQIDSSPDTFATRFAPQVTVLGDAKITLEIALEHEAQIPAQRTDWLKEAEQARSAFFAPPDRPTKQVSMEKVVEKMNEILPQDAIITVDAGNSSGWIQRYYQWQEAGSFLGPTVGSMGYGVPAAVAAKLAFPQRVVIGTSGDGGFMMNGQEFATAIQYGVHIIHIVFNNQSLGTIRMHQEREHPQRVVGTDLVNPDFAKLAKAYGGNGYLVKTTAEFAPALQDALQGGIACIIEVRTDIDNIAVGITLDELRAKHIK